MSQLESLPNEVPINFDGSGPLGQEDIPEFAEVESPEDASDLELGFESLAIPFMVNAGNFGPGVYTFCQAAFRHFSPSPRVFRVVMDFYQVGNTKIPASDHRLSLGCAPVRQQGQQLIFELSSACPTVVLRQYFHEAEGFTTDPAVCAGIVLTDSEGETMASVTLFSSHGGAHTSDTLSINSGQPF